jgi:hypothetical protein
MAIDRNLMRAVLHLRKRHRENIERGFTDIADAAYLAAWDGEHDLDLRIGMAELALIFSHQQLHVIARQLGQAADTSAAERLTKAANEAAAQGLGGLPPSPPYAVN